MDLVANRYDGSEKYVPYTLSSDGDGGWPEEDKGE